jgi:Flp pilus assembly protein TadD
VLGLAFVLITVTAAAFSPMLKGEFLWDDEFYVSANKVIQQSDGWREIWLNPMSTPQYYPVVFTSFWVEYHLWGLNPRGYLTVNLVLHIANSLLLWVLLEQLIGRGAFLAAMIFALHPMHVESVAMVAERKDVLATLFLLASAIAWLQFTVRSTWRSYTASLLLFAAAMLSKTAASPLPFAFLLLAWWREPQRVRRRAGQLVPFLAVATAASVMTLWRERVDLTTDLLTQGFTFWDRCGLAAYNVWFYVRKLAWPADLALIYAPGDPRAHPVLNAFGIAGILAVLAATWALRRRIGRGPLVACAAFLLTLAPILGFVDFAYLRHSFVADHFVYVPSILLIALFAALVAQRTWSPRHPGGEPATAPMAGRSPLAARLRVVLPHLQRGGAMVLVGVLAWATWHRCTAFASTEGIWLDTIAKNPRSWTAHANLGAILQKHGHLEEALSHYTAAIEAKPDYFEAYFNMGTLRLQQHRIMEAKSAFETAADLRPSDAGTQADLGHVYTLEGKYDEAERHVRAALRVRPNWPDAWVGLAFALERQGRRQEAAAAYQSALKIQPTHADARRRLQNLMR